MRIEVSNVAPEFRGIFLSPLTADDKPQLVRYLNDRQIYLQTLRIPYPYSASDADTFLAISAAATARHGHPVNFAIRESDGSLIGSVGFEPVSGGGGAEVGYWLGRPFWGRGIATAAVQAARDHVHQHWRLTRIVAKVFDGNLASIRVLEKNDFRLVARLPRHYRKEERHVDCLQYLWRDKTPQAARNPA